MGSQDKPDWPLFVFQDNDWEHPITADDVAQFVGALPKQYRPCRRFFLELIERVCPGCGDGFSEDFLRCMYGE